jgi:aryl-alcohol dehydrogenase-like predicted oxidoreductase
LALAWVIAQGDYIFPIPGTKRIKYLEENVAAININFSEPELLAINNLFPKNAVSGLRYPEQAMAGLNR